jgi:hypothetical protein
MKIIKVKKRPKVPKGIEEQTEWAFGKDRLY